MLQTWPPLLAEDEIVLSKSAFVQESKLQGNKNEFSLLIASRTARGGVEKLRHCWYFPAKIQPRDFPYISRKAKKWEAGVRSPTQNSGEGDKNLFPRQHVHDLGQFPYRHWSLGGIYGKENQCCSPKQPMAFVQYSLPVSGRALWVVVMEARNLFPQPWLSAAWPLGGQL